MADLNPALDLATALAGTVALLDPPTGSVVLTLGGNLFVGPVRETDPAVPDSAVFALASGGVGPVPYMGQNADYFRASVQVNVRSALDSFAAGEALARGCLRKLHRATVAGYTSILADQPEPIALGQDERGLFRWVVNVTASFRAG